MYVLINQCGDDFSVEAVSQDKDLLRKKLVKKAVKYVKDYFLNSSSDEISIAKGKRLLEELKTFNVDYWDDEDDSYLMAWKIEKAPCLKKKTKTLTLVMAYGKETVNRIEDNLGDRKEIDSIIEEYKDTDALIIKTFKTAAEKKAKTTSSPDRPEAAEKSRKAGGQPAGRIMEMQGKGRGAEG